MTGLPFVTSLMTAACGSDVFPYCGASTSMTCRPFFR